MQAVILCAAVCTLIPCFLAEHINQDQPQEDHEHSLSTEHRPHKQRYGQVYSRTKHTHRGMVQALCKHGHIYSESVRNAMLRVDRANFFMKPVSDPYKIKSRQIGYGADISSAHIHAQMLELLKDKVKPGARILDIGSGSGYLTACLAYLAGPQGKVFGVEHVMELAEGSIKNIDKGNSELLDQGRVQFVVWNGKHGYEREAPYDIIHVSPSYYTIPQKLLDQLVPGGRMIMPVGEPFKGQNLTMIDKLADGYTIVTTVVRKVRTNPLYRDRFQQKKYYNELRRKAQERYNNSLLFNFTQNPQGGFRNRVTYVFKTEAEEEQKQQHHNEEEEHFDHSMSREMEMDNQQAKRNQNQDPARHADKEGEHQQQATTAAHFADSTAHPSNPQKQEWDSSDYEFRPTTQWRWRHHFTYRTNNWLDYDEGFDPANKYNIDENDHGKKLDHTQDIDFIYPDYRNMTHYPNFHELWGNGPEYKKWYQENYVNKSETPYNPIYTKGELRSHELPTIKPLPPGLLKDMARDSFPDHLFPMSDYFGTMDVE
uniref:protein-L-isoaspartate(D-aspartate) O-methyltransferase n=4 Tax=Cacopsylla melanoneura TaxID=428564 RepID=A0A8D8THX0_9HEMI